MVEVFRPVSVHDVAPGVVVCATTKSLAQLPGVVETQIANTESPGAALQASAIALSESTVADATPPNWGTHAGESSGAAASVDNASAASGDNASAASVDDASAASDGADVSEASRLTVTSALESLDALSVSGLESAGGDLPLPPPPQLVASPVTSQPATAAHERR